MLEKRKFLRVNAFAQDGALGNPCVVVLCDQQPEASWAQQWASEFNLSETAFVWPLQDQHIFGLTWFTPTHKVDLCGHGTMASARAVAHWFALESVVFKAEKHTLHVHMQQDSVSMRFAQIQLPDQKEVSLVAKEQLNLNIQEHWQGHGYDMLVLNSHKDVEDFDPKRVDWALLNAKGTILTASAQPGNTVDCVSRYFLPDLGILEDPVTGSIHAIVGPYWSQKLGQKSIYAYQASKRGGYLQLHMLDHHQVDIQGQTKLMASGSILF